ncbi:RNA pyrophosphohydrolase [Dongia sp.]|uniref:RNA pyrophosphohydrolase n=1 Tax=Dongia sp. TaxID=1977262 RepID=UPI0035B4DB4D
MTTLSDAEIDLLPYRRGVGIVLLNGKDEVFVAQRIDSPVPAWQMPQGGIDKGEEPLAAAWRELFEETGVKSAVLLEETPDWLRYDLPRELVPNIWKGRYRGQKQKWFAFRFTGNDGEIDINGEHPEFSEWRWADLKKTPDFIVGFKRPLYEQVVKAFQHLVG